MGPYSHMGRISVAPHQTSPPRIFTLPVKNLLPHPDLQLRTQMIVFVSNSFKTLSLSECQLTGQLWVEPPYLLTAHCSSNFDIAPLLVTATFKQDSKRAMQTTGF